MWDRLEDKVSTDFKVKCQGLQQRRNVQRHCQVKHLIIKFNYILNTHAGWVEEKFRLAHTFFLFQPICSVSTPAINYERSLKHVLLLHVNGVQHLET